ncbi:hypothetical protein BGX28_009169 [Mortierella sp. GBA30]|nr:hypothetical protein BGX28_009169 [Mortierella sp. GBA30]
MASQDEYNPFDDDHESDDRHPHDDNFHDLCPRSLDLPDHNLSEIDHHGHELHGDYALQRGVYERTVDTENLLLRRNRQPLDASQQKLAQYQPGAREIAPLIPSRSRVHSLYPSHVGALTLAHEEAARLALDERRDLLRKTHRAPDIWYQLYEALDVGTIPTPDQCARAPQPYRILAEVPKQKSWRKNSIIGHFYESISALDYQCKVADVNSEHRICGKTFKKAGGGGVRTNHVIAAHRELYIAIKEFRVYHCMIRGIPPLEPDEDEDPSTPKTSRFQAAREDFVIAEMKQPLSYELDIFTNMFLDLIVVRMATFSFVQSDELKG